MKNSILLSFCTMLAMVACINSYAQPSSCSGLVNTGANHTVLLANIIPTLNGAPLPNGSFIIVLYNDSGTLKCGGFTPWDGANTAISAFGDDTSTPEKDGFNGNETFVYRLELPGGNFIENSNIVVQYAPVGGIFTNTNTYALNGISSILSFAASTPVDCPNLNLNIGDPCDDGNPNTTGTTVQGNCTCGGGTPIFDCPSLSANIGDSCNDNDPTTTNDIININCECDGTPTNCSGIGDADGDGVCTNVDCDDNNPQATGVVGSPCNDNNPCTINDGVTVGCGCAGTFQDTDNDGVCDANDDCPNGPNPGTPCDDGNPNTTGTTIQSNCACGGGTINFDCPNLGLNFDAPCDDNNSNTTGTTVQNNCTCGGGTNVFDCSSLSANIGDSCNDGNPCTANDQVTAACICVGTFQDSDGDGVCNADDQCPGFDDNIDNNNNGTPDGCDNNSGGGYCESSASMPWQEWIAGVALANINNPSGKCDTECGYGDFTSLTANLSAGQSHNITLTPGLSWSGHQANLYWRVWIDFNQDNDFSDAGEMVLETYGGSQVVNGSIAIPSTASSGVTRIRIAAKKGAYAMPCENFQQGEVEDYGANIGSGGGGGPVGDYCDVASERPWEEWIAGVALANINNPSGKCGIICGYSDFTTLTANLSTGQSHNITLTPGLSWFGHQANLYWRVWIDFNRDGDFSDAGEMVLESYGGSQVVNGSIAIPATASTGVTRIRIAAKKGAYAMPCESFVRGEVEDYSANIDGGGGGPVGNYCVATSLRPWQEWIAGVQVAGINNPSGKCGTTCGYSDFTNLIAATTAGNSYPFTLTPGLSWSGQAANFYWSVWIDFNSDGDFFDLGETVLQSYGSNQVVNGNIIIPASANTTTTRMRVAAKKGAYATPCETFEKGEVEDYNISITGSAPVPFQTNFVEEGKVRQLKVFPNPLGADYLFVDMTGYEGTPVQLQLSNSLGQVVAIWDIEEVDHSIMLWEIGEQPGGAYQVILNSKETRRRFANLMIISKK